MRSDAADITHYHFCTYFDRNYMGRGLVLYDSLVRHCKRPFTLWVLCFDEETSICMAELELDRVRLIKIDDFERDDHELTGVKAERSTVEYYWTCTPSLPLYILQQDHSIELITYLDADQCFFADPRPIYEELGAGSVLIIEHRYEPQLEHLAHRSGIFNVGLMVFRRDVHGMACLRWWRERCIEWCHAYYEDGKFGDQKYLDDWPERFQGVVVLQHLGGCLAPWNLVQYSLKRMEAAIYVDDQPLILYHFHGCKHASRRIWEPAPPHYRIHAEHVANLYLPYFTALNRVEAGSAIDAMPDPRAAHSLGRFVAFRGLISQRYILDGPLLFTLALWRAGSLWGRANRLRVVQGYHAYSVKQYAQAQRLMFGAIAHNPMLLLNRRVLAVITRPLVNRLGLQRN